MAAKTTRTNTGKKASANTKASKAETPVTEAPVAEEKASIIPKEVDLNQVVTVRNGFQGKLIYRSRKTGELFVWEKFGDEQDMELGELKNARSTSKRFFTDNWFMFDDEWVVDYLGMRQYYKYAVKIEDFDSLFTMKPDELRKKLETMSDGQKRSVSYRARVLIAEGEIDSMKVISTLEECLNTELIDRDK